MVSEMLKIRERVKSAVKENIDKAQVRQKRNCDRKHKHTPFEVGDGILLRNSREDSRNEES